MVFVLYTVAVLFAGAWLYRSGIVGSVIFTGRAAISNQLRKVSARLGSDPVELRLDIKLENLLAIAAKREEALRRNLLVSGPEDFVSAEIRSGEENVRVDVRLKGDLRDHWDSEKWSLRVRVKGGETLRGMRQFSLQHPRTRGYLSEWVYHEALRREDLITLRYEFVRVILNGKDMGIYALEEHFEKRLVENNKLREGPIVRFSEDLSFTEASRQGWLRYSQRKVFGGAGGFLATDVDGFQTSRWAEDEAGYAMYRRALGLLDGFRNGELRTSEAFDEEKLARFLAVTDLLGSAHAAGWRNVRFYFNPVTAQLEPIGFDAGGHGVLPTPAIVFTMPRVFSPDKDSDYFYYSSWFDALFADPDFYTKYIAELDRVSAPKYVREFLDYLAPGMEEALEILHTEFPEQGFAPNHLWGNRAYIRSILEPERALSAYLVEQRDRRLLVAVGSLQFLPVEVLGVELDGKIVAHPVGGAFALEGRDPKRPVALETKPFRMVDDFAPSPEELARLTLRHRMLGLKPVRGVPVIPERPLRAEVATYAPPKPTLDRFEFVVANEEQASVSILPGSWTLSEDLVVPAGWTLHCGEGTTLDLVAGAAIISRSPVQFIGTADAPIVVRSSDGRGEGLVVIGSKRASTLSYVHFEGLSTPSRPGWQLTGAVTFYESEVTAEHCVFRGNTCEDGLNVIRTRFDLVSCLFEGAFSDAFDSDFCEGAITDCSFLELGNDGIDVSGSYVEVVRTFISGAGDKGLSAGEDSDVRVVDVEVANSMIGLASKDASTLIVAGARISGCRYGLAAYQKKPEFGPSRIEIVRLELTSVEQTSILEKGSTLKLEGEEIEGDRRNVVQMLYGAAG